MLKKKLYQHIITEKKLEKNLITPVIAKIFVESYPSPHLFFFELQLIKNKNHCSYILTLIFFFFFRFFQIRKISKNYLL